MKLMVTLKKNQESQFTRGLCRQETPPSVFFTITWRLMVSFLYRLSRAAAEMTAVTQTTAEAGRRFLNVLFCSFDGSCMWQDVVRFYSLRDPIWSDPLEVIDWKCAGKFTSQMKTTDEEHQCTDQGEDGKNTEEKSAADKTEGEKVKF